MPRRPGVAGVALRLLFSLLVFGVVGEVTLRIVYRDAGRRTLYGPGFKDFEHLTTPDGRRGRFDTGPKTPGVPRILAIGDSITYGQGVRRWEDVWPERLVQRLGAAGRPHQMAVVAEMGFNIADHVRSYDENVGVVHPDVLIYQWFYNDAQGAYDGEPEMTPWWQRMPWHQTLRASYFYYTLDYQLWRLPIVQRPFQAYVHRELTPGSPQGEAFETQFGAMAARARKDVRQRWVLLYPQLPYRGAYPLQDIHDWVAVVARREGFGVVDPTARLNAFNTHASWFDGHPNERAHQALADAMAEAMLASPLLQLREP